MMHTRGAPGHVETTNHEVAMTRWLKVVFSIGSLLGLFACGSDTLLPTDVEELNQAANPAPCSRPTDCAQGQTCTNGGCVDNEAPDPPSVNVSLEGEWQTSYALDLSAYLGPIAGFGSQVDLIDQILLGNHEIAGLPIADEVIQGLIADYLPSWLPKFVRILNNVIHIFEEARFQGVMTLHQTNAATPSVSGSERWTTASVRLIDQCSLGESDPNYPACAELVVPLSQTVTGYGTVGAQILPFAGTLSGAGVLFAGRSVQMQISTFVLRVLDELARVATNGTYDSLNAALEAMIDCAGLTAAVEAFTCTNLYICTSFDFVNNACEASRDQVIAQLAAQLSSIRVDWELMTFDQRAAVIDDPADGKADRLGEPPQKVGSIDNGVFKVLVGADLRGSWLGARD
jgi:hypothetical protein